MTWNAPLRGTMLACLGMLLAACASASPGGSSAPPGSASSLVQAGLAAQSSGQTDVAVRDYQSAVAKDPTNKYAYYDLGVIYQQQNDAADASAQYRKALLIDPNYKPALFNLAVLETPTNAQGAIGLYEQLLQLNPDDANVNFNLGLLLLIQGQQAAGHAHLKKALQVDPTLASHLPPGVTP